MRLHRHICIHSHAPLQRHLRRTALKTQVTCTRADCTCIYGPNSEVLGIIVGEFLEIGFGRVRRTSRFDLTFCLFLHCQRQGPSYKTVVFFIFLLTFVLVLIFKPILDFLASGKCCKIEAGLVSLCQPAFD